MVVAIVRLFKSTIEEEICIKIKEKNQIQKLKSVTCNFSLLNNDIYLNISYRKYYGSSDGWSVDQQASLKGY